MAWCLSVRPELRVTVDGTKPYVATPSVRGNQEEVAALQLRPLGNVQFWRDYLSGSSLGFVLSFGPNVERLVILTNLVAALSTGPASLPNTPCRFGTCRMWTTYSVGAKPRSREWARKRLTTSGRTKKMTALAD